MAGPGGGAPRKSHTKSRKGCRTCKRRHIRCDEVFPQCQNCTKHSVRCDYMDIPAAGEEPLKGSRPPDLLTSPDVQQMLDNWRLTGEPPLQELRSDDPSYWTRFSTIDLRLIHHITGLSHDLHRRAYSSCTPWGPKILTLIRVALSSDFAMSALLALSASHLAWQTKNSDTDNLACHHRGVALKGLHEAIGAFSERNSEAILAASMLLSWQAVEWRSWASLQQGVSTVMNVMRPWFHKSDLAHYLEAQRSMSCVKTPPTSSVTGHTPLISTEDLRRLDQIETALHNLRLRLANDEELSAHVDYVISYLQQLRQEFPLQAPEKAFERLQPLRSLLFWLPPSILRPGESDLGAMTMLCHFYALALVLESIFPEIGGAHLGSLSVGPIEYMQEVLQRRKSTMGQDSGLQVALSLVELPVQLANSYKATKRQLAQTTELYRRSPQSSPYVSPHLQLASTPDVPSTSLYTSSPLQSPRGHQMGSTNYFTSPPGPTSARDPLILRSTGERQMSGGSPLSQVSYAQQDHSHSLGGAMTAGLDYYHQSAYAPSQTYHVANSRDTKLPAPVRSVTAATATDSYTSNQYGSPQRAQSMPTPREWDRDVRWQR